MNDKVKGYIYAIIAAATYGMNPLFALPLYKVGMNPDSVLFFRYLFALPILAIMIISRGQTFKLQRREILPLIIVGLLVAISSLTLFQSYNYMDAGIASTLLFVYPIMVAAIMAFGFKEKISRQTMLCILLALAGIAMLARTADGGKLSTLGITLVMISALAFSGYVVAVNKSRLRQIAPLKLTFYVLLFGLSLFFVRVDFGRSLYILQEWHLWANVLALSLFPTIVSFVCTTRAIHSIGSTATSVLGALEPVTAIFFGVTIFHEQLTPRMMLGVAMIIAAVTMIIAEGNIKTYLMALRKMRPKLPLKRIQKTKKK